MILTGGLILFFIIIVKARSAAELSTEPILFGYTIFVITFQLSRLVSAWFYKSTYRKIISDFPIGPVKNIKSGGDFLSKVSIVVPCMNEEKAIENTVTKCFEADYPKDRFEVIVINDGSTDRTGEILQGLKKRYLNLVVVDWKKNRGKRHGMAAGFRLAKGEIVVQLDSDSYIDPPTFRNVIKPFRNPEVGAVSYHTDPENAEQNLLTKMQAAYYFMSFKILKAAESTYGVVLCCSGCASAYRKNIVLPLLDDWLEEKFLGLPVTWGDDRSITNRVLREGYKTIYSDEASAFTICPSTFKQFLKQQIRWKKGWFVNSIFASKFIVRREPFVAFIYFFPLMVVTVFTPFMAARALIYNSAVHSDLSLLFYVLGVFLVVGMIAVQYKMVSNGKNRYWPYLFIWAFINMTILVFLLPYALATIQNRKWGTR